MKQAVKYGNRLKFVSAFFVFILTGLLIQNFLEINLPAKIQDTITLSLGIIYEALPFIFLGVGLSVAVQQFIKQDFMMNILPKKSWLRRPTLSLLGIFLPVCECGNVPLARGLIAKGLSPSEVLTFLFAAPIINPITIFTTIAAFQFDNSVVVIRVVSAFVIANAVGWLFVKTKRQDILTEEFETYCSSHSHDYNSKNTKISKKITNFATSFQEETSKLLPALIGGSFVAGIIQTTIPRTFLTGLSDRPVLAIIAMIFLAFIVSICANVDAFFALSLSTIFPISAVIAFLVFGPMIDIKMLALLKTTFTKKVLIICSAFIFLATLFVGLVVQYVL